MSNGGFSKTRLGRIHDVMTGYVERGDVPGVVTLISRRGETLVDAVGQMAIGGDPIARDTIFRMSSMTKPVAAVAAMILVEECRLRLDDPVDRWLPELADRRVLKRLDGPLDETVPANRPITARDVLTFRMGHGLILAAPDAYPIQRAMSELGFVPGPPNPAHVPAPNEWMRRLGTLPLVHQPGERWMYNTASDVLGVLIARVSGQPFDAFLRERIFEPLGMKDTGFSVPEQSIDRLATSYSANAETGALDIYDKSTGTQWSRPPAFPSGAGGLVSTVDDYLAFAQMMLNHGRLGGERIVSRPTIELMTTNQLVPEQMEGAEVFLGENQGWGFGLSVVTRRDDIGGNIGTYGWAGGLGTLWSSDPREELITILMTQSAWTSASPPLILLDCLTSVYQAIDD